jgi:hypothetical protein
VAGRRRGREAAANDKAKGQEGESKLDGRVVGETAVPTCCCRPDLEDASMLHSQRQDRAAAECNSGLHKAPVTENKRARKKIKVLERPFVGDSLIVCGLTAGSTNNL